MKLSKAFICVLAGEIYPVEIEAGQECPPEHEDSAHAQGCIDDAEYEAGVALRPQADEASTDEDPSPDAAPPVEVDEAVEAETRPAAAAPPRKNSRG